MAEERSQEEEKGWAGWRQGAGRLHGGVRTQDVGGVRTQDVS